MAQGFKKQPHKQSSTTSKHQTTKDTKKGARVCPPKKDALIARSIVHRKNTSSHAAALEKLIATQAISHGKLTIMRSTADESEAGRKAARAHK